jgi:ATP-dependent Lon protease
MSSLCDWSSSSIATIQTSNRTKILVYNNMSETNNDASMGSSNSIKHEEETLNKELTTAKKLYNRKYQEYQTNQTSVGEEIKLLKDRLKTGKRNCDVANHTIEEAKLKYAAECRICDAIADDLNCAIKKQHEIYERDEVNECIKKILEVEKAIELLKQPPREIENTQSKDSVSYMEDSTSKSSGGKV